MCNTLQKLDIIKCQLIIFDTNIWCKINYMMLQNKRLYMYIYLKKNVQSEFM